MLPSKSKRVDMFCPSYHWILHIPGYFINNTLHYRTHGKPPRGGGAPHTRKQDVFSAGLGTMQISCQLLLSYCRVQNLYFHNINLDAVQCSTHPPPRRPKKNSQIFTNILEANKQFRSFLWTVVRNADCIYLAISM